MKNAQKNKITPAQQRLALWPGLVLAVLVMGFCLFVGASSIGLLAQGLRAENPHSAIDEAYQTRMFQDAAPAPGAAATNDPTAPHIKSLMETLHDAFVDINGLATGAMGQRELNGVVKLNNGYISAYLPEKQDLAQQVAKTVEFSQFVQGQGKQFVFVMAPHLISKFQPLLPVGVADYHNEMADEFLQALAQAGVPAIDLRQMMRDEGFDHYGGFFRTDHHWTPAAANWASHRVMRELAAWGWMPPPTVRPDDFAITQEGVRFYGTAAARTGEAFAGEADVLPCLSPVADIPLYTKRYSEENFSGPISFNAAYRDWQAADYTRVYGPDAYYLYKSTYQMNVLNENAAAGTSLLLVCDSFGVPFQSFAAAYVRTLTSFDGRSHPELTPAVAQSDIVMVLYNPSSLDIRTENQGIFNFQ